MADLGVRKFQDLVGRTDLLKMAECRSTKGKTLDLTSLLKPATELRPNTNILGSSIKQNFELESRADNILIKESIGVIDGHEKTVSIKSTICNVERAYGSTLSYHIAK